MAPCGPEFSVFWSKTEKGPSVEEPAPWPTPTSASGVPPQKVTPLLFGVAEAPTVKVPLMMRSSSARAPSGIKATVIAPSASRAKDLTINFLFARRAESFVMFDTPSSGRMGWRVPR